MKLEKKLFKISLLETLLIFVLIFIVLNGLIFIYELIKGNPGSIIYNYSWVSQIVYPFIIAIIQTAVNRNGLLNVSDYDNYTRVSTLIDSEIQKNRFIAIDKQPNKIKYDKKTKWSRFFNIFYREKIIVEYTDNQILIYSKRNILSSIERKLRFDKTISSR